MHDGVLIYCRTLKQEPRKRTQLGLLDNHGVTVVYYFQYIKHFDEEWSLYQTQRYESMPTVCAVLGHNQSVHHLGQQSSHACAMVWKVLL